jgi:hypothetical protein
MTGKTGANAFLAGGGIQGIGPGDGGNPAAWAGLGQAGQQHDFAKNFAEQGKGAESFSRAGQDVALQQIPGLQNFQSTGAGQHSDITVEQIKAATALQQAAMKAKSAGVMEEAQASPLGSMCRMRMVARSCQCWQEGFQAKIDAYRESRWHEES